MPLLAAATSADKSTEAIAGAPAAARRVPVAAVVLTFNEELNLEACLRSLSGWVQELYVVDSGSTDATLDIARRHGAQVLTHPFETHARQWQWALAQLPASAEWVLALDADQSVTPELSEAIAALIVSAGVCAPASLDRDSAIC